MMPTSRRRLVPAAVASVLLALTLGVSACSAAGPSPVSRPTGSAAHVKVPRGVVNGAFQLGSGRVAVTIYTDASCPHCKKFDGASYTDLAKRIAAGDITLRIHPMNYVSTMHRDASDFSTRAMNVLAAIADSGQGDRIAATYHGILEAQPTDESTAMPDDAKLLAIARANGVELTSELRAAVTGGTWNAWVQQSNDVASGTAIDADGARLQAVPTVTVENRQFQLREDGTDASRLGAEIDAARSR